MNTSATAQFPEEREAAIMNFLHRHERIRVSEVTDLLHISPSTARLLLQKMQDNGMLKRVHGGAVLPKSEKPTKTSVQYRDYTEIENREAKLKIGKLAAETVEDGDYICLGSGTTVYLMSTFLHGKKDLTVVTDSMPVAYELLQDEAITVHICGGWVMKRNSACRGMAAEKFFKDIRVDKSYNGADSIDLNFGTTSIDFDPRTETAISHCGKKCFVLADSSKFKTKPFMDCVIRIEDIDTIVTDKEPEPEQSVLLTNAGINIIIP